MKKIVTFRAASMGDALMAKFLFENILPSFPDAKYYLVVSKNILMIKELLHAYPWINVVEVNRKKPLQIIKFLLSLWQCDLVVLPPSQGVFSNTSKLFARVICKKGMLWGYEDGSKLSKILFSRIFKIDKNRPVMENELEIIRSLDLKTKIPLPTFSVNVPDPDFSKRALKLNNYEYVVVNLFSGSNKRGLSHKNRQRLVDIVVKQLSPETKIVLTAGPHNKDDLQKLCLPQDVSIYTGSVSGLLQVLYFSKGVVSVDTGVAHICSGLKKPLLVLCSFAARTWWKREQHPNTTTIIVGKPGKSESDNKLNDFPESLNNFNDRQIIDWLKTIESTV